MAYDKINNATDNIRLSRVWGAGLLAVIAANLANILLGLLTVAAFDISPAFLPLQAGSIFFFTTIGVAGAALVFALFARFARRPVHTFKVVALVVLILSLLPDLALLRSSPFAGTTPVAIVTLMFMHVASWAVSVSLLTTLTHKRHGQQPRVVGEEPDPDDALSRTSSIEGGLTGYVRPESGAVE